MAILHVRNIPKPLYERARRIAARRGKSLSAMVIELLEELDRRERARRSFVEWLGEVEASARQNPPDGNPAAADVIRECREERERQLAGGRDELGD